MGAILCVDGSVLTVTAVACRDRTGKPYEVTLELTRDREPFATVGERCGHQLSALAARVSAAREDPEQAGAWPDPDDRFPAGPETTQCYPPGECEYLSLRSRDLSDPAGAGEFRCTLRASAEWLGDRGGHGPFRLPDRRGGWRLTRRALIEAWGAGGIGVRAVLTSAELVTFLDTVLRESGGAALAGAGAGAGTGTGTGTASAGATTAGSKPGGISWPRRRQRGRVPDETARSRLPALRAQA
jgi:hypothetical protein